MTSPRRPGRPPVEQGQRSTPRRLGRPRVDADDPCVDVMVRVPSKQYDDTFARARRERVSVPEIIRRALRQVAAKDRQQSEDGEALLAVTATNNERETHGVTSGIRPDQRPAYADEE